MGRVYEWLTRGVLLGGSSFVVLFIYITCTGLTVRTGEVIFPSALSVVLDEIEL